jgi:hypothetical protein
MCPSGASCIFPVGLHYKNNLTKRVGVAQTDPHLIEN